MLNTVETADLHKLNVISKGKVPAKWASLQVNDWLIRLSWTLISDVLQLNFLITAGYQEFITDENPDNETWAKAAKI